MDSQESAIPPQEGNGIHGDDDDDMSDDNDPEEVAQLEYRVSALKLVLEGVQDAEFSDSQAGAQLAATIQEREMTDGFVCGDGSQWKEITLAPVAVNPQRDHEEAVVEEDSCCTIA
eukprot:CAMPEP_0197245536 /NCGR_PEP_ID=MMETSP1429-20130617/10291_1 /TAXON_ID=49237 /ORGANISM="Chaetoceros  sp., Strain UNC1202" /LENGTH=115 /DNA_ID=CAMNT_0042706059 /DNA_START=55 /DNA_END=402 /DNA_ORIENTATION=+